MSCTMPLPPTRPALRARYDRRRQELVDVAATVFAEQGYQATSMDDLSEATGLAAGGLYHYIDGKEQLLFLICDELLQPLLVEARAIVRAGGPPEDVLRTLVRTWVLHVQEHRTHMLVFQQERHVIERDPRWSTVRDHRKQFERLLDGVLKRGVQEGDFTFADRGLTLLSLLAMVNSTPQWLNPAGRLNPTRVADGFCDIILATPPAPAAR